MAIVSDTGDIYETEIEATAAALGIKLPSKATAELAGELKSEEGTQVAPEAKASPEAPTRGVLDKLLGTTGERYKLWPERMIDDFFYTAGKVSQGQVPMWAQTEDGEYHTSIQGLEASHKMLHGGTIFPKIHLRGPALKALEAADAAPENTSQVFSDFMRNRGRRQESNIIEGEVLPPEPPATPVPTRRPGEADTDFALRTIEHILNEEGNIPLG